MTDRRVIAIREDWGATAHVVKSLTTHWSAGAPHSVNGNIQMNEPWRRLGLNLSLNLNPYLHDRGKYNVTIGGNGEVRIFRGFSLNFGGNYAWVRDQLFIRRTGLTDDELLTRQRQLETAFRYFTFFGLSYRFGSIYNNTVIPRFGGER